MTAYLAESLLELALYGFLLLAVAILLDVLDIR